MQIHRTQDLNICVRTQDLNICIRTQDLANY